MELLIKYITGEASPEEAMTVEEWIQAAPENKREFEELLQTWIAATPSGNAYQQPDVAKEWETLKKTTAPVKRIGSRRLIPYLAAACLFLLIGILGWHLLQQSAGSSQNGEVVLMAQAMQQHQLPDQSLLTLDANSTVTYKKDFDKATRELMLEGEGFFKVVHNPQRPFIIDMDGVKLQVLGTSFRVHNNRAAQQVNVDVVTGKVMLYNEQDTIVLTAGQSGTYYREEKRFERLDTINVNNYSYATKHFAFADTPLDQVATYLEKTYKVKIQFQNPAIKGCRLSAQFDQQPIEDILEVIASTFDITYSMQEQTISIDGKGCH